LNNVLLEIKYNGKNYAGFQVQENAITITEVIQKAITKLVNEKVDIKGCSRTDSKVHANQYFLSFKTTKNIPVTNIKGALNKFLPNDIAVVNATYVSDGFHPRYHAMKKEYIYKIYNSHYKNPFLDGLALHYRRNIDVEIINEFCEKIIGTRDFLGFSNKNDSIKDTVRTVFDCKFYKMDEFNYIFSIIGDGFLYNMVRVIVGTALQINEGVISIDRVNDILVTKNRKLAGKTAPAHALYLNKVDYFDEKQ